MMGRLDRSASLSCTVRLEELVPADHLLRRVDQRLDLTPVVAELRPYYASTGRPSIAPELMLRMLLIGYLYGIRSERRLVEEVRLNLAYRWFCGLALDKPVPDASTFSKNRHGRFRDAAVFRRVFERVVDLCVSAGHACGKAVSVDGSFVAANASPVRRVDGNDVPAAWREAPGAQSHAVQSYLADLDRAAGLVSEEQQDEAPFVPKHTSLTDPQAAWSRIKNVGCFGYKAHFLIDNAHGIILDAEGTDARLSLEIVAARVMLERQQGGRGIAPGLLAADESYGTGAFLAWLAGRGIEPMVPVLDRTHQTNGMFARDSFAYDAARDLYVCPSGHELRRGSYNARSRTNHYRARLSDCASCPLKPRCTTATVRKVERHWDEEVRERVRQLAGTPAFLAAARARRKVEARFAQMKHVAGLNRLRLRGIAGVREQVLLAAAALNLRSLVKLCPEQPA